MNEPLSGIAFQLWLESDFRPHTIQELESKERLTMIEASLAKWLKVTTVALTMMGSCGAIIFALFFWILLEKNADIKEVQRNIITLTVNQRVVMESLATHLAEGKNETKTLLELLKQRR